MTMPAAASVIGGHVDRPERASQSVNCAGAEAGEDQEAREHHRDGVERMPEKDREALHEGDLDEEEGQAQAREEQHDPPARGRGVRSAARGRRSASSGSRISTSRRNRALHQGRDQDDEAPFHQRQAALRAQRQQLGQRRPLQAVEEERAVVGRGPERELVALGEAFRVGAEDGGGTAMEFGLGEAVVAVGVVLAEPRMPDQVEGVSSFGEGAQPRNRPGAPNGPRRPPASWSSSRESWRAAMRDRRRPAPPAPAARSRAA